MPSQQLRRLLKELRRSCLSRESTLSLGEFHRRRASLVIVRHMIDPRAHGIAPHQPIIEGFQKFGCRIHIVHSRIEPQVIIVRIKNQTWALNPVLSGLSRLNLTDRGGFHAIIRSCTGTNDQKEYQPNSYPKKP